MAKGLGLPKEITRVLLKKGMQSDPAYTRLYSAAAEYFLPRWHGEAGEVETLANEIATAAGEHGYAAMGHMAFTVNRYDPSTLFYGRYDWKQLAKAGDALARSYPNDPDLVAFAAACARMPHRTTKSPARAGFHDQ